jgi:hypothetical protein
MKLAALLLLAGNAFAAIDGVVNNQTTGKPQAGAVVTLVQLGSGMNTVGSVRTDAAGNFRFDAEMAAGTPYLIQALHAGVTYNQMLEPGSPSSNIQIPIYDASANVPDAKVVQHMVLLEPSSSELVVNQTVIFSNTGTTTYQDPDGTLRFTAPENLSGSVQVRIIAPQGMPITRPAEPGKRPGEYRISYPIKPGETRIDINYAVAGPPAKFEGAILHGGGPIRFIAPRGVTLEGESLTNLGPEPRTQATVYELKADKYSIAIQGTGMLRPPTETSAPQEDPSGGISAAKPLLYKRLPVILGLVLAMLAVGFLMLARAQRA